MTAKELSVVFDPGLVRGLKEAQQRHVRRVLTLMYTGQELPDEHTLQGVIAELANSW